MTRIIKFRAINKRTLEVIDDALEIKDIGLGDGSVVVDTRTQSGDELIWLQFTGLTDRNGVEIYENDIYKWLGFEVRSGKQIRPERIRSIQSFEDWIALYNLCTNGVEHMGIEVIGSIHTHPELLEAHDG